VDAGQLGRGDCRRPDRADDASGFGALAPDDSLPDADPRRQKRQRHTASAQRRAASEDCGFRADDHRGRRAPVESRTAGRLQRRARAVPRASGIVVRVMRKFLVVMMALGVVASPHAQSAYDQLLDLYVRDGFVYYRALKQDRAKFDAYVAGLSTAATDAAP